MILVVNQHMTKKQRKEDATEIWSFWDQLITSTKDVLFELSICILWVWLPMKSPVSGFFWLMWFLLLASYLRHEFPFSWFSLLLGFFCKTYHSCFMYLLGYLPFWLFPLLECMFHESMSYSHTLLNQSWGRKDDDNWSLCPCQPWLVRNVMLLGTKLQILKWSGNILEHLLKTLDSITPSL